MHTEIGNQSVVIFGEISSVILKGTIRSPKRWFDSAIKQSCFVKYWLIHYFRVALFFCDPHLLISDSDLYRRYQFPWAWSIWNGSFVKRIATRLKYDKYGFVPTCNWTFRWLQCLFRFIHVILNLRQATCLVTALSSYTPSYTCLTHDVTAYFSAMLAIRNNHLTSVDNKAKIDRI